ncbi:PucR family transcriptional regulator [Nocardiopsis aegyptia]|uniref:Purine catabolism regulator n=1 Tax=Nocardiopsis aegyptia TaxID=220378 RepID=A0A7Z0J8C5_9ACTN|nr:PucR family transcriptional regulator ligand-binding domain-containing protein [Nocardiopsis aegyptia]NYJ32958.1 purine catabolism regulator [Nocardiopsis aegyptia]
MITVRDITGAPDLEVRAVAGRAGLDRPIRWAHVTELHDPVHWLRGGELVLTAGLGLGAAADDQRAYVRRLHDAGCVGVGVALDDPGDTVPPAVVAEGDRLGLPVLAVEGETPFIAVVEAVAAHHAAERGRAQSRVLTAQDAMARAALRSGPAGVVTTLASSTGGRSLLLDRNGMTSAASPAAEQPWHRLVRSTVAGTARRPRGMAVLDHEGAAVLLQNLGPAGRTLGWLALHCGAEVTAHTRMLANHAASLLAVDLLHSRDTRRALHRQRAPHVAAAVSGRAAPPLTLPDPPWEVVVLPCEDPRALVDEAADALSDVLGATDAADRAGLCALADAVVAVLPASPGPRTGSGPRAGAEAHTDPGPRTDTEARTGTGPHAGAGPHAGERLLRALAHAPNAPRGAGACGARGVADLPSALTRARQAASEGYRNTDEADAWDLFRSAVPREGARAFTDSVLGPLHQHDRRHGTDLAHTLLHYLDHGAQVEAAARDLGVHRNTLRSRLRTAERVLGRPLDAPRTRLELWTALSLAPMPCRDRTWHA